MLAVVRHWEAGRSTCRHSRERGNPEAQQSAVASWIPAFAGMTRERPGRGRAAQASAVPSRAIRRGAVSARPKATRQNKADRPMKNQGRMPSPSRSASQPIADRHGAGADHLADGGIEAHGRGGKMRRRRFPGNAVHHQDARAHERAAQHRAREDQRQHAPAERQQQEARRAEQIAGHDHRLAAEAIGRHRREKAEDDHRRHAARRDHAHHLAAQAQHIDQIERH